MRRARGESVGSYEHAHSEDKAGGALSNDAPPIRFKTHRAFKEHASQASNPRLAPSRYPFDAYTTFGAEFSHAGRRKILKPFWRRRSTSASASAPMQRALFGQQFTQYGASPSAIRDGQRTHF